MPFGDLGFTGFWDANANSVRNAPPGGAKKLIDKAAMSGPVLYYVEVAGATPLGGITDWNVGDWAVNWGWGWSKFTGALADPLITLPGAVKTPKVRLSKIAAGQAPMLDMFSPFRDGVNGDETLANAILSDFNYCGVDPGGPFTVVNGPIVIPTNAEFEAKGGQQAVFINRAVGYSGDTVQMGKVDGTGGAGSAVIRGFGFNHPGRFLGVVPGDYALQNRLTNDTAHIRACGVQGAKIIECFGWGMPHFIIHQGGSGLDIVRLFSFGGMFNPRNVNQQESISVFNSRYDPVYGYSVNCNIIDPNLVGGNISAVPWNVPIDSKTYLVAKPRIGPYCGYLMNCFEVFTLRGGFSGGFASTVMRFEGGGPEFVPNGFDEQGNQLYKPAHVMIRFEAHGHAFDESMVAGVEFVKTLDTQATVSGARFTSCNFNGQLIGARGMTTTQNGKFAVANLVVDGGLFNAYQGATFQLFGVDGGLIAPERIRGYNTVGFDTRQGTPVSSGAAIYIGDATRNLKTMWPVIGGGPNRDLEGNNCQWGYADVTNPSAGNRYYGLDAGVNNAFLGMGGGGLVTGSGATKFVP